MAIGDFVKKLFKNKNEKASVVKAQPAEPKVQDAPKFEAPTSMEIVMPRLVTVDGVCYGTDDGRYHSLEETKNFSAFRVGNELEIRRVGEDLFGYVGDTEIGKIPSGYFASYYKAVEEGNAVFRAKISDKDEAKGRINFVYYLYNKLDPEKSMCVKLNNTQYIDSGSGEKRYDNLANAKVGDEVTLNHIDRVLPNGEIDYEAMELGVITQAGGDEVGIILPEDERAIKARFMTVTPLVCKIESIEWATEGDNSTISATIRVYDVE